ncbi:MAG: hypothetical protein KKC55_16910, partial [Gammaproteobacteria bacterium]|nr:hypothetical protein [Gammaproteobacteria bacterium]
MSSAANATVKTRKELFRRVKKLSPEQRALITPCLQRHYGGHFHHLANDPVGYIQTVLGEFLWSKQREIAEAVRDHRKVAVHACHSTGKSWLAGRIVPWFVTTAAQGDTAVVTTAPTMRQVKNILWKEIRRAVSKGELPGDLNLTEWKINDELVAFGQKPADWDPSAFQGIHELRVLVILDECCGIPESIIDAAVSLASNEDSRVLAIGNPDDPTSFFARMCRPGSGWHVIHVGWGDTPNHPDSTEEVPDRLRKLLISQVWVEERAREWGVDSPKYIARVLGLFPEDAADSVVPLSLLMKCAQPREYPPGDLLPIELGVDVGAGGDFTSIRERRGRRVGRVWRDHSRDLMTVTGLVVRAIRETGASAVKVDEIGIGAGVRDRLEELRIEGVHPAQVIGVNVGSAPLDPTRFPRLRDQIWFDLGRGLSQDMVWDFSVLDEDERDTLFAQLIAP